LLDIENLDRRQQDEGERGGEQHAERPEQDAEGDGGENGENRRKSCRFRLYHRSDEIPLDEVDDRIHGDDRGGIGWSLRQSRQCGRDRRQNGADVWDEGKQAAHQPEGEGGFDAQQP